VPKLYVRDSGLLHALLAIESLDDVLSHPVVGASWGGCVIEQLITAAGDDRLPSTSVRKRERRQICSSSVEVASRC